MTIDIITWTYKHHFTINLEVDENWQGRSSPEEYHVRRVNSIIAIKCFSQEARHALLKGGFTNLLEFATRELEKSSHPLFFYRDQLWTLLVAPNQKSDLIVHTAVQNISFCSRELRDQFAALPDDVKPLVFNNRLDYWRGFFFHPRTSSSNEVDEVDAVKKTIAFGSLDMFEIFRVLSDDGRREFCVTKLWFDPVDCVQLTTIWCGMRIMLLGRNPLLDQGWSEWPGKPACIRDPENLIIYFATSHALQAFQALSAGAQHNISRTAMLISNVEGEKARQKAVQGLL